MSDRDLEKLNLFALVQGEYRADAVAISRTDLFPDQFKHVVFSDHSSDVEQFTTPRGPYTCCLAVVETGKPLMIPSGSRDALPFDCPMMRAEGFKAYLGVPLVVGGRVIGALEVMARQERAWSASDVARLQDFARIAQSLVDTEGAGVTRCETGNGD